MKIISRYLYKYSFSCSMEEKLSSSREFCKSWYSYHRQILSCKFIEMKVSDPLWKHIADSKNDINNDGPLFRWCQNWKNEVLTDMYLVMSRRIDSIPLQFFYSRLPKLIGQVFHQSEQSVYFRTFLTLCLCLLCTSYAIHVNLKSEALTRVLIDLVPHTYPKISIFVQSQYNWPRRLSALRPLHDYRCKSPQVQSD